VVKRSLVRLAFASGMGARTSDLRRLYRCLALGAAVLARRCHARTEGVCTLLCFLRSHFLSSQLRIKSECPSPNASLQERVFLYRKEHLVGLDQRQISEPGLFPVCRRYHLIGQGGPDLVLEDRLGRDWKLRVTTPRRPENHRNLTRPRVTGAISKSTSPV
jgi:hypothetical protein